MPAILHSLEDCQGVVRTWREAGETVALVPTMGSLHEGHKALVRRALELADRCVVSIFVNPLQFGPGEDFDRYPRGLAADEEFLADTEVDIIFAPDIDVMYPEGPDAAPTLSAGPVGELFEGAARPGHFDGVLTVVKRLFDYVTPDVAVFGLKDAQQVFLIHQMVQDRALPVRIEDVDTVRDADGLALSSRNTVLTETSRQQALGIPRALEQAATATTAQSALGMAREILEGAPGVSVDYIEIVDPSTFVPWEESSSASEGRMIIAATVGGVRLIDNRLLHFGQ